MHGARRSKTRNEGNLIHGRRFPKLLTLSIVSALVVFAVLAFDRVNRQYDRRLLPASHSSFWGFVHYLAGDYAVAARYYRVDLVAGLSPRAPDWWRAYLTGDLETADRLARRDLQKYPDDVEILLSLAETALAARRFEDALARSARVLALRPDDYDALLIAAAAHARRGAAGDAIDTLNRALRHNRTERRDTVFLTMLELTGTLDDDPTSSPCLLAHLHRYLRIFDASHARIAERYARQAIASGDHADDAYVTLGVIFEKTGRRRYALEAFRSGAALNPRNVHALRGAARRHADRGEIAEEYRFLKQAFEAAPDDPLVVNEYHGFLTGKLGDYPKALALDRAAVASNPSDTEAWWRLGTVHSYLGDHTAALSAHRRAAKLAPRDPRFQDHIGLELLLLGRLDEARAAFEASLKIGPGRAAPHAGLGDIHAKQERWPEARRAYETAYQLGGHDVETVVNLCQVYQAMHEDRLAFACLSEVLTRDPDNVRARVLLEHAGAALALKR